jgi:hypothetical protein
MLSNTGFRLSGRSDRIGSDQGLGFEASGIGAGETGAEGEPPEPSTGGMLGLPEVEVLVEGGGPGRDRVDRLGLARIGLVLLLLLLLAQILPEVLVLGVVLRRDEAGIGRGGRGGAPGGGMPVRVDDQNHVQDDPDEGRVHGDFGEDVARLGSEGARASLAAEGAGQPAPLASLNQDQTDQKQRDQRHQDVKQGREELLHVRGP